MGEQVKTTEIEVSKIQISKSVERHVRSFNLELIKYLKSEIKQVGLNTFPFVLIVGGRYEAITKVPTILALRDLKIKKVKVYLMRPQ